jgi:hypothetical protein
LSFLFGVNLQQELLLLFFFDSQETLCLPGCKEDGTFFALERKILRKIQRKILCICNVNPLQSCMWINATVAVMHCSCTTSPKNDKPLLNLSIIVLFLQSFILKRSQI